MTLDFLWLVRLLAFQLSPVFPRRGENINQFASRNTSPAMRHMPGHVGRFTGLQHARLAPNGKLHFTFQQVTPLLVRVLMFRQCDAGFNAHVATGNFIAVVHLAINAIPDFELFLGGVVDERHECQFFER